MNLTGTDEEHPAATPDVTSLPAWADTLDEPPLGSLIGELLLGTTTEPTESGQPT